MGWLRLVGSLKSQVSFAEHSLFHRALLQKRPIIGRSLLIVATPYSPKSLFFRFRELFVGYPCSTFWETCLAFGESCLTFWESQNSLSIPYCITFCRVPFLELFVEYPCSTFWESCLTCWESCLAFSESFLAFWESCLTFWESCLAFWESQNSLSISYCITLYITPHS